VKCRIVSVCFLGVLFLTSFASPQREHPTESLGKLEIAKHPLVLEPPIGPKAQKLDLIKLRAEADELARLAQSVPADIDQAAQGKFPSDVTDKLKHIEKLSKRLRGELAP
jgi:hypothetical protein